MKNVLKVIFAAFLCYHLAAVGSVLLPAKSQLRRSVTPIFSDYLTVTGNKQHWSMFTTIPYNHGHDVSLEVTDGSGTRMEDGVLLPDLAPYDDRFFRYHTLYVRMLKKTYEPYLNAYVNNAKERLEARDRTRLKSATVHLKFDRTQNLVVIRRTGKISKRRLVRRGPFKWP